MHIQRTIVGLSLAAFLVVSLHARQRGPEAEAEAFRQRLLDAFARGDRQAVAGMVRYRLVVDAGGIQIPVLNQAALVKMWDAVFPPAVRCVVEESGMLRGGSPPPKYVMQADATGVTFGRGWIRAERGPGGMKAARTRAGRARDVAHRARERQSRARSEVVGWSGPAPGMGRRVT